MKDTVGVIPVHIGGFISPKWKEIKKICDLNNLFIIEDSAHAHGSQINNKFAGSLGLASAFSFYPTKILTTGEGGIITTNNRDLYKKSLLWVQDALTSMDGEMNYEYCKYLLGAKQRKSYSMVHAN